MVSHLPRNAWDTGSIPVQGSLSMETWRNWQPHKFTKLAIPPIMRVRIPLSPFPMEAVKKSRWTNDKSLTWQSGGCRFNSGPGLLNCFHWNPFCTRKLAYRLVTRLSTTGTEVSSGVNFKLMHYQILIETASTQSPSQIRTPPAPPQRPPGASRQCPGASR